MVHGNKAFVLLRVLRGQKFFGRVTKVHDQEVSARSLQLRRIPVNLLLNPAQTPELDSCIERVKLNPAGYAK
jgi:hypothetical protein